MCPLPDPAEVGRLAAVLIEAGPSPVVEYRLRRDVLAEHGRSPVMQALRARVLSSRAVLALADEQRPDGSWGRFHSQDTTSKTRFVTSERAVDRALALGLDGTSPVLSRAVTYMTAVLAGRADWPDPPEKAESWEQAKRLITAATLSLVDAGNPAIGAIGDLWARVARDALAGAGYSAERENAAFRRLTGVAFRRGYLGSRYTLSMLGSRSRRLPPGLGDSLLGWVWSRAEGIGYLGVSLRRPDPARLERWLRSLEILALFPGWHRVVGEAITWLWSRRRSNSLWDFGQELSGGPWFPLSDHWRRRGTRAVDHTTRILVLLAASLGRPGGESPPPAR